MTFPSPAFLSPIAMRRSTWITGLGCLATLSVIARPSALLTFGLIALAGQLGRAGRRV